MISNTKHSSQSTHYLDFEHGWENCDLTILILNSRYLQTNLFNLNLLKLKLN